MKWLSSVAIFVTTLLNGVLSGGGELAWVQGAGKSNVRGKRERGGDDGRKQR